MELQNWRGEGGSQVNLSHVVLYEHVQICYCHSSRTVLSLLLVVIRLLTRAKLGRVACYYASRSTDKLKRERGDVASTLSPHNTQRPFLTEVEPTVATVPGT